MQEKQIREAVALLRDDNLVWSPDFEQVRLELATLLEAIGRLPTHQLDDALDELLLKVLCESPDDITALDPFEAWLATSTRQMSFITGAAARSSDFKDALKRLFGQL